jgi:hypothetical protein
MHPLWGAGQHRTAQLVLYRPLPSGRGVGADRRDPEFGLAIRRG